MEIRWQGLRDIMKYDKKWRQQINNRYRQTALASYLRQIDILENIKDSEFEEVTEKCLFETYGSFDWNISFKRGKAAEPIIAREGDYPVGLLIRAGFARLPNNTAMAGERSRISQPATCMVWTNSTALGKTGDDNTELNCTISALGYVDIIRIPLPVLESTYSQIYQDHLKRRFRIYKEPWLTTLY